MGPRKFAVGDMAFVNERAPRLLRGRTGLVIQVGPTKGEYGVEFRDGRTPSLVYLEAMLLDVVLDTSPTVRTSISGSHR
jgi:hypothetical protein